MFWQKSTLLDLMRASLDIVDLAPPVNVKIADAA
jgi:hypothetical protein